MKKTLLSSALALCLLLPVLNAQETDSMELSYSVGLNYSTGYSDLIDAYELFGYDSDFEWPIGLNFAIAGEFDNNLGWETNLGPTILIMGDVDAFLLPLDGLVTYHFSDGDFSPFVKAGGSYLFASGDYIDGGAFGVKAAVGVEFSRSRAVSYGVQASYNSATIDFGEEYLFEAIEIKPYEFVFSFYMSF